MGKRQQRFRGSEVSNDLLAHSFDHKPQRRAVPLKPRNERQAQYIRSITNNDITFGLGPAGTGKTYVAASLAAEAFRDGGIEKLIITRPAVEAGENIGFLPGELGDKIEPYFVPVREVIEEVLGKGPASYAIENKKIEFVPLAFMRGRTFKNAAVILDEAQNTTPKQMKMFLSRLGEGTTIVVNGDVMQSDIPGANGLWDARARLSGIPGIGFVTFKREDIVRHGLVRHIIDAYEGTDEDEEIGLPSFITDPVDRAA